MAPAFLDPHYLWAAGHLIVLLNSAWVMFKTLLFQGTPTYAYRMVFIGAILSYSIVVLKSLGKPSGAAWVRRALADENAQYGLLAVYWLISKPINITILPYATFSLFHCATFLRTNILPKFYAKPPAGAAAGAARPAPNWAESLGRRIQLWVKGNYDKAMNFVAYAELAILIRSLLGAITFRSSFITPILLAHFIRMRYHASPFTRNAMNNIGAKIDSFAAQRGGPVLNTWTTAKRFLHTWVGGGVAPGAAAPAGAAPAAGAGAANGQRR